MKKTPKLSIKISAKVFEASANGRFAIIALLVLVFGSLIGIAFEWW